jgi:hypothetical protein
MTQEILARFVTDCVGDGCTDASEEVEAVLNDAAAIVVEVQGAA